MALIFRGIGDWIDFLARFKMDESDLPEIRIQGKFTNDNRSSFAYCYTLEDTQGMINENTKVSVSIERRLWQRHPARELFSMPNGAIFPYSVVRPPFNPPEFLELSGPGRPKKLQEFWTDFGQRARESGYKLQEFDIGFIPEYVGAHISITGGKAEIREHDFFTPVRVTAVAMKYTNVDIK